MCPNWPKNEVFVSFLKFKPSDSADFAYLRTKLAPNYFNVFFLFSLEIVDFAHLS